MRRTFTSLVFLVFFSVTALFVQAQIESGYLYNIEVSGVNDGSDVKLITAILRNFDPENKISYSETLDYFKMLSAHFISVQQLSTALFDSGYHIGNVTITFSEQSTAKSLPTDFPQKPNSGNEAQDAQNYQQAKTQWVQENEERYNSLNSPEVNIMSQKEFNALSAVEQERLITNGAVLIQE